MDYEDDGKPVVISYEEFVTLVGNMLGAEAKALAMQKMTRRDDPILKNQWIYYHQLRDRVRNEIGAYRMRYDITIRN